MAHKVIDIRHLGDELRKLQNAVPKAVVRGMREGSLMLRGALVQVEIAKADPTPVDQGQYKGAWGGRDVEGGAIVFNLTKHAAFVERGRRPGRMPPMAPIREWVRRKGLWKGRFAALKVAARKSSAVAAAAAKEARGASARNRRMLSKRTRLRQKGARTLPTFAALRAEDARAKAKELGRTNPKFGPKLPRGFRRRPQLKSLKNAGPRKLPSLETQGKSNARADARDSAKAARKVHSKYAKHGARFTLRDRAINEVAMLIRRKIGNRGTKGHGILWLGLRRLQPKLPGIIKRSIREVQP